MALVQASRSQRADLRDHAPVSGIAAEDFVWTDGPRQREVPVRLFAPSPASQVGPFPLVVMSHGGGESRDSFDYLGRHWAEAGYIVVCIQHLGSDGDSFRRMVRDRAAPEPAQTKYGLRCDDIRFVLEHLRANENQLEPLKGRMDFGRLSVSGQCAGSTCALATVGLTLELPGAPRASFPDARVKAVVALGPQLPYPTAGGGEFGVHPQSWADIEANAPVMMVTGTRDFNWISAVAEKPERVRMPYDRMPGAHKFLLELRGAEHHAFTDSADPAYSAYIPLGERDPRHHQAICRASTAFLDAYLKDDQTAYQWLCRRELEETSQGLCRQEHR